MKKKENPYKFIKICYFSVLPSLKADEYIETLDFYAQKPEKITEDVIKEFKLFWNAIKGYVKFLSDKDIPIPFKSIILRRDDEKFIEKMQSLHKNVDKLSKILKMRIWQVKALVALTIWRKEHDLKDLLKLVHDYCEKKAEEKVREEMERKRLFLGVSKIGKGEDN